MSVIRHSGKSKTNFVDGEITETEQKPIAVTITIHTLDQPGGFCKGVALLLEGIAKRGSLMKAAVEIDMAYSKAWVLIKEAEANLGVSLIARDGARGSALTVDGKKMLRFYKKSIKQIGKQAASLRESQ